MKISELIARLQELPPDWEIFPTRSASLEIHEPGDWRESGHRYGWLFPDGTTRMRTKR